MFADVDPTLLGGWFIALSAVIVMAWMARQLYVSFFPTKREGEASISRDTMDKEMDEIREGMGEYKEDFTKNLEKLYEYAHKSVHEMRGVLQQMSLRVEALLVKIDLMWEFHLRRAKLEAAAKHKGEGQ